MQCQARGHVEAILFIVIHGGEVVVALLDDHMAGGAGARSTAGMFNVKAEMFGKVEQAEGFAVVAVRNRFRGELVGGSIVRERDFRHDFAKGPV